MVKGEAAAADRVRDITDQSTSARDTRRPRKTIKTRFEVNNDVAYLETDKSTLEVDKDDVLSPNKKTVRDAVDILVDSIQLK